MAAGKVGEVTAVSTRPARVAWWTRKRFREGMRLWLAGSIVVAGAVVMMIPLAWMISTSVKDEGEVFITPVRWIPGQVRWQNYPEALTFVPYWRYFVNTV